MDGATVRSRRLLLFLLTLLAAAAGFSAGGYIGLMRAVDRLGDPSGVSTGPTYIYSASLGKGDDTRRVIGIIYPARNHLKTPLRDMPPGLLNAVVVKEDRRFREHGGVDLWGIIRALYADLKAGRTVQGASTITQQYVKNAYLSPAPTLTRKLREALISIEIERHYSKDEILAKYLNTVYFGNNAYGVGAASETYFGKPVKDLTTAEAATLVGLLWSPSTLGSDKEAARKQRDLVLKKMLGAGYITEQDYERALHEPMPERWPSSPPHGSGLEAPMLTRDFAAMVEQELTRRYGTRAVLEGNLSVYTTLDLEDQTSAWDVLYGPSGHLSHPGYPDAALVSLDPRTGDIKAMIGGHGGKSDFNLATQGRRQPGSSFKPFALIAAIEQVISPKREYVSEKKTYHLRKPGGRTEVWKVDNYGGIERGPITLENALWQSDNTVFTDLVTNAKGRGLKDGPEKVVEVAREAGVEADYGRNPGPSVVLGTKETSPLEMAQGYATIANEGRRLKPRAIVRVMREEGKGREKILYDAPASPGGERVIPKDVARKTLSIMIGDVTQGIAREAALPGRQVAGKTGTSENFFDSWFIGSTPQLTTAVWMGYAKGGKTLEGIIGPEAQQIGDAPTPTIIWHDYMQRALQGEPVERFDGVKPPSGSDATDFYGNPLPAR
ncbi:transglycosylase domain-containing protein [Rubrobacter calidifluminis]|uniref:transglycosylase domain-containing protein n=1 Tax=Rubrobacter calidifluminis TaxID=1392640 RepID=UPI00235E84EE|nr:transglycosylase domain-containing protein [Rubrobacter calidifluminis]